MNSQSKQPSKYLRNRAWIIIILLLGLWLLSEGIAGWQYHPFRDDWFTLGYPNFWHGGSRWEFYLSYHLDSYRPLSFLVDIELLSRFWPHLTIVAAMILALMFWTVLLWRRALSQLWGLPFWGFAVLMLWLPLTDEGQYWITASVGIVLGLWFLGWAWVFLARFVQDELPTSRRIWWVVMTLAFLAADLCYEQYWFSVIGLMAVVALKYRRQWLPLLASPVLSLMLTAFWYLSHSSGMRDNGKVANHSVASVIHSLHLILPQIITIWGSEELDALKLGVHFDRVPGWWLILAAVLGLGAIVLAMADYMTGRAELANGPNGSTRAWNRPWSLIVGGIIWAVASYFPWLVTHYDWVADRSVTVAAPGIALVGEAILAYAGKIPWRLFRAAVIGVLTFLLVALLNLRAQDIMAYNAANAFSGKLGVRVLAILNQHHLKEGHLTVADPTWTFAPWTYTYHDHISTAWDANWAVHYMLADLSHGRNLYQVTELWPQDPEHKAPSFKDTGVILTPARPSLDMVTRMDVHQAVVVQYQDQFSSLRIVQVKWYHLP
ncbi:MAG: hypothetical protein M1294_04120 [Firmicutes bacterium]|nr:hypothetical protein [Bacillota bacterium]MCL5013712.1 hypothetical protein [Bacillota bacterium]HBQ95002.1 hypothetical protein [Sulfobacillus sp.]